MAWRVNHVQILNRMPLADDWQEKIIQILIEAGTDGIPQSKITFYFSPRYTADEIVNELEVLEAQHKVQKFRVGGRGRPKTVWRATTEIMKQ